jgi:hypothetical protein
LGEVKRSAHKERFLESTRKARRLEFQLVLLLWSIQMLALMCPLYWSNIRSVLSTKNLVAAPTAGQQHNWNSAKMAADDAFYCRYYVGHKGKFGHEFMEFEFTDDGKLRYANNSNYKNDVMIRKEGRRQS